LSFTDNPAERTMRCTGTRLWLAMTIFAVAGLSVCPAFAAGSEAFCSTWLKLCNKTCPDGPGSCGGACAQRDGGCRTSGCFFFNIPGPRCEGNRNDDIATAKTRDRLQRFARGMWPQIRTSMRTVTNLPLDAFCDQEHAAEVLGWAQGHPCLGKLQSRPIR
jgi:hypothetical protein